MSRKVWHRIKGVLGYTGTGALLLPIGLTNYRWWALGAAVLAAIATGYCRERKPRIYNAWVVAYFAVAVFLLYRVRELIDSVSSDVWIRILYSGALLALLWGGAPLLEARWRRLRNWRRTAGGEILTDLAVVVGTIVILRLGQWQLWQNPAWFSGTMLAAPILYFRPRPAVVVSFAFLSATIVLTWHGFMNTQNIKRIPQNPPAGVDVHVLDYGHPEEMQGARFFIPSHCGDTEGGLYMGEMKKTYRLNADSTETPFVVPDENGFHEAVCSVVEMCDRNLLVSGSDEGKFVRFSDRLTGRIIKDVPLIGQPTFVVLSPDKRSIYASVINPGAIVRIDIETMSIDRQFLDFVDRDRVFSGINNIIIIGDRIFGAYSSYLTVDNHPGEVLSVNLDLEDHRTLFTFTGSWGMVAPADSESLYFKIYSKPNLYQVAFDGSGARVAAELPAGYHYLVRLQKPSVVVISHWATGEYQIMCTEDFDRRYHLDFGGMGRPMTAAGNVVMTAVPAGYATITLDEGLCGP